MAVLIVIAYAPALFDSVRNPGPGAPRFTPENPTPMETNKTPSTSKPTAQVKTTVALPK
jgi:cytochrome c oxidase subunit 1